MTGIRPRGRASNRREPTAAIRSRTASRCVIVRLLVPSIQTAPSRERRGFSLDMDQRLIGTSIACHEITFGNGLVATLLDYQDLEVKLRIGGKECCWHRYLSQFGR